MGSVEYLHTIQTKWGDKQIRVFHGELDQLPERADALICSAFWRDYTPTKTSLIGFLQRERQISVAELSAFPELDLRDLGVWVSRPVEDPLFGRIICVEMQHSADRRVSFTREDLRGLYDTLFFAIRKCQQRGMRLRSVALHILGTGNQAIDLATSMTPLITECVSALRNLEELRCVTFFDRNAGKLEALERALRAVDSELGRNMAFISYSHTDAVEANLLAESLEACGIKPWIDHRMIRNADYAADIVQAIQDSRAFLLLVSSRSMASPDVLREVRNAATVADTGSLLLCPLLLESGVQYAPGFAYYLTGLDRLDLASPPIEDRIEEACRFVAGKMREAGA